MAKVSVIIPTRNRAHFLKQAIDSVLAQTFTDYEIIVVDDGSTDATKEALKEYGGKIRYFFKVSGCAAVTRNFALSQSRGEYIAFLDDDDIWLPNKLEVQMNILESNPDLGFLSHQASFTDETAKAITGQWQKKASTSESFAGLYEESFIHTSSIVIRKQLLEQAGGFDESLLTTEDYDLWLRLSKICKFKYFYTPLTLYRMHPKNKHKNAVQKVGDRVRVISKPENTAHLNFVGKRIRVAKEYYNYAQWLQDLGQYWHASKCYFKAVLSYPFIGSYYWPEESRRIRSSRHYRILRTYLKSFYCLLRALGLRKVQYSLKKMNISMKNAIKEAVFSLKKSIVYAILDFFWSVFSISRMLRPRKHFGFLSEEFFAEKFLDDKLCDIGGFGMTAKIISQYYSRRQNRNFEATALFNRTLQKQGQWRFRINESSVFTLPDMNAGYIKSFLSFLKYSLQAQKDFHFLLSIDLYPGYKFSLKAMPHTPLLIWLRDPKGEEELRRIGTVEDEIRANKMHTLDKFITFAKIERDFFYKIYEQSKASNRQIIFVTNAHCLTSRARGLYNLRELNPYFLPNPIHYPPLERIQKSKHPTVCLLGRLDPVKRPWIFFELAKKFKNVEFMVCGQSSYPEIINPIIDQYRAVENLKFLGLVQGENKAEILSKSWILVNTSIHEGLPCSFLESFAYGTPIVSSVNPDDLVSKFGFYTGEGIGDGTDEHTMRMFQEGLDKFLSDKSEVERIGLESRKFIEKIYTFEQFEKGLESILAERFRSNYTV